jgi:hypothetical protein
MAEPQKPGLVQFVPRPATLTATIRQLAQDSGKVGFGGHSLDRMDERGITRLDALRVLRLGSISGEIEQGRNKGEWKCKMVHKQQGSREIGVVTVVVNGQRLFVKTVEWEDT